MKLLPAKKSLPAKKILSKRNNHLVSCLAALALTTTTRAAIPDSVYVRPFAPGNADGIHLSWSTDGQQWQDVQPGRLVGSDFGAWGSQKKCFAPSLCQGADGTYVVAFQVNDRTNQFAICTTRDFQHWRPQEYPYMPGVRQCLAPVVCSEGKGYTVTFQSEGKTYATHTDDLLHFTAPKAAPSTPAAASLRVPYIIIENIKNAQVASERKSQWENESANDDARRFANLGEVKATLKVEAAGAKQISDKLIGIFFEDINYAADGGLNAQLIQNGDFEYVPSDRGNDQNWDYMTCWHVLGDRSLCTALVEGISPNNNRALQFTVSEVGKSLQNEGFDGIPLIAGAKYDFSMYLKGKGKVEVSLVEGEKVLAKTTVSGSADWKQVKATLRASADAPNARLSLKPLAAGQYSFDMVSLIPQDTYKGHGLRRDLCETLAALHPQFMRFPGGCVAHGDGLHNIYNWKETIGPLQDRKPARNLWGYHQSRQMGYYEFFQMCEDMQMEPLPVLAAGVSCQNSSTHGHGQQGGLPWAGEERPHNPGMPTMEEYIQDVLDLVEWANGDPKTSRWAKMRAEAGHPKPFNLKYIGIGNEDLISATFTERYLAIIKAVKERYPDITVCGTVGPFFNGSDYEEGWRIATENHIDMVDEHYYTSPGWYIYNQDFYDHYDRTSSKVYLGEYAAHIGGRRSTIETALACALHICSLERNGDVVELSSYAPLLAREGHTQWNPDLIYFNNQEVKPTVDYFAQMMHGQSAGETYVPATFSVNERQHGVRERLVYSVIRSAKTGKTYLKLVNLLPKAVSTDIDLTSLALPAEVQGRATVLTGRFDDTQARPADSPITVAPQMHYTAPAYSFTVIEF